MSEVRSEERSYYHSKLGVLEIKAGEEGITSIRFVRKRSYRRPICNRHLSAALGQMDQYFKGRRKKFQLSLVPGGTNFQKTVWRLLDRVPFGSKVSYRDLAEASDTRGSVRAVAGALSRNPIAVVIPCHRVVMSGKGLGGYAWGAQRKIKLLQHEREYR